MKTTIDYSDKTAREAVSDVLFYIGFNPFKKVVQEISKYADNVETRKSFMIGLEFAGVQGYPAKAMLDRYLGGKAK
jgi:hypothetical protein|tara:strand:+ start:171 stop:398 length:228 start_codon:yes stop_codon:yes gene_type:complete